MCLFDPGSPFASVCYGFSLQVSGEMHMLLMLLDRDVLNRNSGWAKIECIEHKWKKEKDKQITWRRLGWIRLDPPISQEPWDVQLVLGILHACSTVGRNHWFFRLFYQTVTSETRFYSRPTLVSIHLVRPVSLLSVLTLHLISKLAEEHTATNTTLGATTFSAHCWLKSTWLLRHIYITTQATDLSCSCLSLAALGLFCSEKGLLRNIAAWVCDT